MDVLLDPTDAWIDREVLFNPRIAQLRNNGGDAIYFDFPSTWSDEDIMTALAFANKSYGIGFRQGRIDKARQIRLVLEEQ